ncbi:unnamed protein product [Ilex paraguariensis]|uniref:Uncharacterized protein n=1 Tax=Ilex paraguariensis TaxID=185542 RepID=A0ABC8SQK8_9AQUA
MGRAPCCDKTKVKRGPWSPDEDEALKNYLHTHGTGGNWIALPPKAGLKRCGKSCRLRWLNYLRPDIKHGAFTEEEDNIICNLYSKMGSRWSVIAAQLPGRTDNDVKNHWNTKLKKKLLAAKSNPTSNMNEESTYNHASLHFSTPYPVFVPKVEACDPGVSALLNQFTAPTMPFLMDVNYGQTFNSQSMVHDPSHSSLLGISGSSEFGFGAKNSHCFTWSEEGSSISGSSSLAMDNNYGSWSGNGAGGYEGLSMGLGTGFPYDLMSGNWSQETVLEAVPSSYATMVNKPL